MHLAESNLGVRSRSRNFRVAIRRLFSINLIAYFEFRISPKLEREREREKEREGGGRGRERERGREGGRERKEESIVVLFLRIFSIKCFVITFDQ